MHFWQALKMALKSLKTNKLRSFLTMLGIIIGVMTVSLLTSVAQGVTDAVVSSVKSQSTLAVFVTMNDKIKYDRANELLKSKQPSKDADDYFEYSLIYSTTTKVSVISKDKSKDELVKKKPIEINFDELKDDEDMQSSLYKELIKSYNGEDQAHEEYYGTEIMAVDRNFPNVYEFEYEGKYMENSNEIMVDSKFVEAYFGENVSNKDVLNREVKLGINQYTMITFSYETDEEKNNLLELANIIPTMIGYTSSDIPISIKLIYDVNGNYYLIDENEKTISLKIEIISNIKNEALIEFIDWFFDSLKEYQLALKNNSQLMPETTNQQLPSEVNNYQSNAFQTYFQLILTSAKLSDDCDLSNVEVTAEDIIDRTNEKTYKIVAVISDSTSSIMSSMTSMSSDSSSNSVLLKYMNALSSTRGLCYLYFDKENIEMLGEKDTSTSKLSYAYLRYKDEKVMNSSIANIILAFTKKGDENDITKVSYTYLVDFMLISFSSVANIISKIMNILTIMLTVISVISLIVGGIGIMNIMLVAVTERTREIGIRKAIGAKKSSILVQFLVEALLLSLLGGLIGLGISAIGMMIISHFMGVTLIIPLWVICMSVGFCTAIGLIFGMFPAVKASNMQPIDALRRE